MNYVSYTLLPGRYLQMTASLQISYGCFKRRSVCKTCLQNRNLLHRVSPEPASYFTERTVRELYEKIEKKPAVSGRPVGSASVCKTSLVSVPKTLTADVRWGSGLSVLLG